MINFLRKRISGDDAKQPKPPKPRKPSALELAVQAASERLAARIEAEAPDAGEFEAMIEVIRPSGGGGGLAQLRYAPPLNKDAAGNEEGKLRYLKLYCYTPSGESHANQLHETGTNAEVAAYLREDAVWARFYENIFKMEASLRNNDYA